MATIANCLQLSRDLTEISDSPRLDTEVLLAKALGKTRTYLYTWPESAVAPDAYNRFIQYFRQRQQGRPVAYIVGEKEFWSLSLLVDNSTLIPRPETELLVETALSLHPTGRQQSITVADLGTGTGAIAIALASERPHWTIYALDKCAAATILTKKNCRRLRLKNVNIVQGDWLSALDQTFDLIVSNPPYIDANDKHLSEGDVRFEPRSSLISGGEGLADIEKIIVQSYRQLLADGWLLLEHGYNQAAAVQKLFQSNGFSDCFVKQDIGGNNRVSGGRKRLDMISRVDD